MKLGFSEIEKWKSYEVLKEIDDVGQHTISTRQVFAHKDDGSMKASYVAILEDK